MEDSSGLHGDFGSGGDRSCSPTERASTRRRASTRSPFCSPPPPHPSHCDQEGRNPITTQQALGAPIAASVSLFGVFAILKYTDISVGVAYQVRDPSASWGDVFLCV